MIRSRIRQRPLIAAALLLIPAFLAAQPTADGIFARFQVSQDGTSLGNFTARLEFEKAPLTVANFVGLAEGSKAWIDPVTYEVKREPFYDGIIFHRVIDGFVIQGGSPQGTGSDGPGYVFHDEFDPTLRHNAAGILSMANSGPSTNGSQFFVTLAATASLNDLHSVFGSIVEGYDVVADIGAVDTTGDNGSPRNRPLEDVVIDSVEIFRNGTAAQEFDISAQPLPKVTRVDARLRIDDGDFVLDYPQPVNQKIYLSTSPDLSTWTRFGASRIATSSLPLDPVEQTLASRFDLADTHGFASVAAVAYPDAIHSPPNVVGKEIEISNVGQPFVFRFLEPTSSSGSDFGDFGLVNDVNGDITAYSWEQEPYWVRSLIFVDNPNIRTLAVTFTFESATTGAYSGAVYPYTPQDSIGGTFILRDAP